eukprot:GHRR01008718.1.p1 GENE.GHRR01008718.1~~GHRR01008718.1.p1  ORF type:complete len:214 (+),score=61.91 GHRR01008718.1:201-842(+)
MDIEPIYCAEQIAVPPYLAEVLKKFSKEVIRKHPTNLLEFSASYFADQAAQHNSFLSIAPPSKQQLRQVYLQLKDTSHVPLADFSLACETAGIAVNTLNRIVAAGCIDRSNAVSVLEVLLLLLSMSCETFTATMQAIFEVFGTTATGQRGASKSNQVAVSDFLALLEYLGARDPEITSGLQKEVAKALAGQQSIDYQGLAVVPALGQKLSAER